MIELKNVSYEIKGNQNIEILKDVSCSFCDSEMTVITGQNGSGKSTLTKIVMGIIKPTSGKVLFDGKDITDLDVFKRAKLGFNYAFQQPVLFKGVTVKDLIDYATNENNSVPNACKYLSQVGLCAKDYIDRDFDKTLSGGEQKRIELALALAKKGKCYIFDEPEAGIDIWSFEKLSQIFDRTKCNIVVSHQERLINIADKVIVLNNGTIEKIGKPKDIVGKTLNKTCKKLAGGKNER